MKLHRFQVYNSITHYLYIVLCVHHPKSSLLPSPFITPLPSSTSSHTPFPLVINMLLCQYFFFLLNPFTFSHSPSTSLPSNSCQSVLCIYESFYFVYFVH